MLSARKTANTISTMYNIMYAINHEPQCQCIILTCHLNPYNTREIFILAHDFTPRVEVGNESHPNGQCVGL